MRRTRPPAAAEGEERVLEGLGVDAVIDRLVDPDAHGVPAAPTDPWAGVELPLADGGQGAANAVDRWLDLLLTADRPLDEWMAWYWHGHLVSSVAVVVHVPTMVGQIRLFRQAGLDSFPDLLRAVTVDAAMLRYLDGGDSTAGAPNENYSRELLELFALGVGNYTEDDVQAGARALTGWRIDADIANPDPRAAAGRGVFVAADHDDAPQRYLGRQDVHDLDTVIDAVVSHEACAPFVAARLGQAVLGPDVDPALLAAQRATGAALDPTARYWSLYDAGHLPFWPPNVGGWPGGANWLTSSTTAQRYNLAGLVAAASDPDGPARRAAAAGDLPALADALGRPAGLRPATAAAVADVASTRDDGLAALVVALASPDLVLA